MSRTLRAMLVALGLGAGLAGTAQAQTFTNEGNFAVYVTVQLATTNVTTVTCDATLAVADTATPANFTDLVSATGSISGTTATCILIIPYGYALAAASTTYSLDIDVTAAATNAPGVITHSTTRNVASGAAFPTTTPANTGFNVLVKL